MSEATYLRSTITALDNGLVAHLLGEALALLESDRVAARARIEHARALAGPRFGADEEPKNRLAAWQLKRVDLYVRSNLTCKLRIEEVARQVHLSKNYFSRVFKATTGISYSEFLIQARIEKAKILLISTDAPICEIALQCGLSDQSHLTRLFRRSGGPPPGTWRRRTLGTMSEETGDLSPTAT